MHRQKILCVSKPNKDLPGVFSTPVIPFISRQWNYGHWIYRADEDSHRCLKCNQTIATGGNDDFSNSCKHVVTNHPEISAWEDVLKHTSAPIIQYKLSLERNFHGKIVEKKKSNSLGFPATSTSTHNVLRLWQLRSAPFTFHAPYALARKVGTPIFFFFRR